MDASHVISLVVHLAESRGSPADRQAEDSLNSLSTTHLFHLTLLQISTQPAISPSARLLSALYLKNGVDKHWRKSAKSVIAADEKQAIRNLLISLVCEESPKLSRAYAEAISKIAQIDYPHEWPDVIPTLLNTIQSTLDPSSAMQVAAQSNPANEEMWRHVYVSQQHSLYTLHRVVKGLYAVRTVRVRHVLYQLAPHLFQTLSHLFTTNVSDFASLFPKPLPADPLTRLHTTACLHRARLALKLLRRLIVNGFPERDDAVRVPVAGAAAVGGGVVVPAPAFYKPFEKTPECVELFSSLTGWLNRLLEIRNLLTSETPPPSDLLAPVSKICLTIGKLYTDLLASHAVNFLACDRALDVVRYYWGVVASGSSEEDGDGGAMGGDGFRARLLLQGLGVVRGVVKNSQFSVMPPDRHPFTDAAVELVSMSLLTNEFVHTAAHVLVTKYLSYNSDELAKWEESPEEFVADEEADQWEFNLRMCAQKLMADLMNKKRAEVAPVLMAMLRDVANVSPSSDANSIRLKDAVYSTVAFCAYYLYDYVEFDSWFSERLLPECTSAVPPNANPLWKLVRRRVPVLVAHWIGVKSDAAMRSLFYRLLIHLASPEHERDLVIRLTAVYALRVVIGEGLLSDAGVFEPYTPACVHLLLHLATEAEEFDTKVSALTTLKEVVYMMGIKIAPFVRGIVERLPALWEASYDQIMFRTAILLVLGTLVKALQDESAMLHPLVLPAIQNTLLGGNATEQQNFIEDAIDLWVATLQNAPTLTTELVSLYPCLTELIELGSAEHLKTVLRLLEAYFVLDAGTFCQHPATVTLFSKFAAYLAELKLEPSKHIARTLNLITRVSLRLQQQKAKQTPAAV